MIPIIYKFQLQYEQLPRTHYNPSRNYAYHNVTVALTLQYERTLQFNSIRE